MSILLGDGVMSLMEANQRHFYEDTEEFYRQVITKRQTLDVIPFLPSNGGRVHEYAQAKQLGIGYWRNANEGYTPSTGKLETITQNLKLYSGMSKVSEDNVMLEGVIARTSEDDMVARGILEGFLNEFINADGKNPKGIRGLAGFRPKLSDANYCLDAGGTTEKNLTSLYLCEFGPTTLNVRYDPAMTGNEYGIGLKSVDRGLQLVPDAEGKMSWSYVTTYDMTAGVELRDESALVRVANVDVSGTFPQDLLVDAINMLPSMGSGAVILAPRSIYAMYTKYAINKENIAFTVEQIEGLGRVLYFLGVPIIMEDAIKVGQKLTA